MGSSSQNESLSGQPITSGFLSLWSYRHKDFLIKNIGRTLIFYGGVHYMRMLYVGSPLHKAALCLGKPIHKHSLCGDGFT